MCLVQLTKRQRSQENNNTTNSGFLLSTARCTACLQQRTPMVLRECFGFICGCVKFQDKVKKPRRAGNYHVHRQLVEQLLRVRAARLRVGTNKQSIRQVLKFGNY